MAKSGCPRRTRFGQPCAVDPLALEGLLREQAGVVSRRQVLAAGFDDSFIRRRLRRREWARVHTGVFVDHTGPLEWWSRAWAAVLFYWPAALSHVSALTAHDLRTREPPGGPIHVAVDQSRRVRKIPGVELHRVTDLSAVLQPNRRPARIRLEHSLLDVASAAGRNAAAIAMLADACQCRRTTPARLVAVLETRLNLPRRSFLLEVLGDVAAGVYSVLEHRYLTRVERPHGLPTGKRQRRVRPGRTSAYRDVEYVGLATVAELDGRLGHEETSDRWDDMDRDIDSLALGDVTLRIGWRHVEDPCRTAISVGRVLTARGWTGEVRGCSDRCPAFGGRGASQASGA